MRRCVSRRYLQVVKDQRQPTPDARTEALFARRLRELRAERGLSQAVLAERLSGLGLKIDPLAILRIEKNADDPDGGRRIRLGEAALIARALGVRLEEMLRSTAPPAEDLKRAEAELYAAVADLQHSTRLMSEMSVRTEDARARVREKTEQVAKLRELVGRDRGAIDQEQLRIDAQVAWEKSAEFQDYRLETNIETQGIPLSEAITKSKPILKKHYDKWLANSKWKDLLDSNPPPDPEL